MTHHAVLNILDNLAMTEPAGLFCDTQIAGVHETDELWRLVIQPRVRVRRISGCLPEFRMPRRNVRLLFRKSANWISAVAIGATEDDV